MLTYKFWLIFMEMNKKTQNGRLQKLSFSTLPILNIFFAKNPGIGPVSVKIVCMSIGKWKKSWAIKLLLRAILENMFSIRKRLDLETRNMQENLENYLNPDDHNFHMLNKTWTKIVGRWESLQSLRLWTQTSLVYARFTL